MGYFVLPAQATRVMVEALDFFCGAPLASESLLAHFAPSGAIKAVGALLFEGRPFFIQNAVMTSLRLFELFNRVVWWRNPKLPGQDVSEVHLVLDASARVVPYEDFVKAAGLGPGVQQPQSHPLADIPWEHRAAGGQRVLVQQIVWAGACVGKVGEFTVYR
jgi:hypothetical protein